jgi:prolyl oligopeptidase PreP (S9A serine peptidase family)
VITTLSIKTPDLKRKENTSCAKALEGADELFLDINTIAENGLASASLLGADDQNRYMAVNVNQAGSDWSTIEVYDIATKQKMSDQTGMGEIQRGCLVWRWILLQPLSATC